MGLEVALQVVVCAINYPLLMLDVVDYSQPFYKGHHQKAHQSTKYTFNRRAIKLHMLQCFQNGHI